MTAVATTCRVRRIAATVVAIGIGDLDCPDISARRFRVLWNVPNPDPHRFDGDGDGDGDGIGCES